MEKELTLENFVYDVYAGVYDDQSALFHINFRLWIKDFGIEDEHIVSRILDQSWVDVHACGYHEILHAAYRYIYIVTGK